MFDILLALTNPWLHDRKLDAAKAFLPNFFVNKSLLSIRVLQLTEMTQGIFGKLFGDRGYISQELFEKLYEQQLQLITCYKKNMKQKLVKPIDKILLRKRALIETVNVQLQNIFQIEHSRHCSIWNFLVNLMVGLIAYTYLPKKPSIDLEPNVLALPFATF